MRRRDYGDRVVRENKAYLLWADQYLPVERRKCLRQELSVFGYTFEKGYFRCNSLQLFAFDSFNHRLG
jgi:hypothetical protein